MRFQVDSAKALLAFQALGKGKSLENALELLTLQEEEEEKDETETEEEITTENEQNILNILQNNNKVYYKRLPTRIFDRKIIFSYLPPFEEYDAKETFLVPINEEGFIEPSFKDEWTDLLRDVLRSYYNMEDGISFDEMQEKLGNNLNYIYSRREYSFPYAGKDPELNLVNNDVYQAVRTEIIGRIQKDWVLEYKLGLQPKFAIEIKKLRPLLNLFINYMKYGIYSDFESIDKISLKGMRGLSEKQWKALKPFAEKIGIFVNDEFTNIIDLQGQEERMHFWFQQYLAYILIALVDILDTLVAGDDYGEWVEKIKKYMDELEKGPQQFEERYKELRTNTKPFYAGLQEFFFGPDLQQYEPDISKEVRYVLPQEIQKRCMDMVQDVEYRTISDINAILLPCLIDVIDLIKQNALSFTNFQEEVFLKALNLSGANENIVEWDFYNMDPTSTYKKELEADIIYIPREQIGSTGQDLFQKRLEDLISGWKHLTNIVFSLFGSTQWYDKALIEDQLQELENLELVFGSKVKLLKSSINAPSTQLDQSVLDIIQAPLIQNQQVAWDSEVSPTIVEPILNRIRKIRNVDQLLNYINLDQMVKIGMARHSDKGSFLVTGITHSVHPDTTRKFVVGIKDPLTGMSTLRLDVNSELRLLQKWQTASKLIDQFEQGVPPDTALQKALDDDWKLK